VPSVKCQELLNILRTHPFRSRISLFAILATSWASFIRRAALYVCWNEPTSFCRNDLLMWTYVTGKKICRAVFFVLSHLNMPYAVASEESKKKVRKEKWRVQREKKRNYSLL